MNPPREKPGWLLSRALKLSRQNAALRHEVRDLKLEANWLHDELAWLKRQMRGTR
jgi:hypothetical protein